MILGLYDRERPRIYPSNTRGQRKRFPPTAFICQSSGKIRIDLAWSQGPSLRLQHKPELWVGGQGQVLTLGVRWQVLWVTALLKLDGRNPQEINADQNKWSPTKGVHSKPAASFDDTQCWCRHSPVSTAAHSVTVETLKCWLLDPETWREMGCQCKVHTGFKRFSRKKECKLCYYFLMLIICWNNILCILGEIKCIFKIILTHIALLFKMWLIGIWNYICGSYFSWQCCVHISALGVLILKFTIHWVPTFVCPDIISSDFNAHPVWVLGVSVSHCLPFVIALLTWLACLMKASTVGKAGTTWDSGGKEWVTDVTTFGISFLDPICEGLHVSMKSTSIPTGLC